MKKLKAQKGRKGDRTLILLLFTAFQVVIVLLVFQT